MMTVAKCARSQSTYRSGDSDHWHGGACSGWGTIRSLSLSTSMPQGGRPAGSGPSIFLITRAGPITPGPRRAGRMQRAPGTPNLKVLNLSMQGERYPDMAFTGSLSQLP